MSNILKLPYVMHRSHSNSSFERRKDRKLEELSVAPRAQIPSFLVGEQTASLFKPLEYDLAQIDNRDANINRSPSRTGSLTSGIYGELPLSAVCGSFPASRLYDEHSPLSSPRPQSDESMKSWLPREASSRKIPKSLSKIQQTLGIKSGSIQETSAFSDTSSDYSPWTDSNRDSWQLNPKGLNLQPPLSPTSHPATTAKAEIINEPVTPKTLVAPSNGILSPFATQPTRPPQLEDRNSEGFKKLHEEHSNKNTDSRPGLVVARKLSDEDTKSLKDILSATEEDQKRWLAVHKMSSPPSIKQHDEILHSRRKDRPLPSSNTPSRHRKRLTIQTKPATKRSQVTWSPSIPKRASYILEEARESFKRGVDELSSPTTSRSGQSFLLSPSPYMYSSSEHSTTPSTPNTALSPFPNFHSTTRLHFFPGSPIPEEKSHFEPEDKVSELKSTKGGSGKYNRKRFGWRARHPLKSPHPHSPEKGSPKDALGTIVDTAMRIGSLSSSRNEKERKNSTSIIMNHQRSDCGPDTPFPTSSRHNTGADLSPVTSPAYENLLASPAGSPLSGLVGSFRHAIGVKTKDEREKIELERLKEEKEARRKDILEERGIRLVGEVVHRPGSLMDEVSGLNYVVPTSLPTVPGSAGQGGKTLGSERGESGGRASKASGILGVPRLSPRRGNEMKLEEAELHAPKSPDTPSSMEVSKALPAVPASIRLPDARRTTTQASKAVQTSVSLPASPMVPLVDLPILPKSAVNADGTTWF